MYKTESFKVPIYGHIVKVVLCDNLQDYTGKELQDVNNGVFGGGIVYNFTSNVESPCDFLVIFEENKLSERIISHEAFHIAVQLLRHIDMPLTRDSEEGYAYLNEWIYMKLRIVTFRLKQNGNTDT